MSGIGTRPRRVKCVLTTLVRRLRRYRSWPMSDVVQNRSIPTTSPNRSIRVGDSGAAETTRCRRSHVGDVVLAVDVGATHFQAGLVTSRGVLIDRARAPIEVDVGPESQYTAAGV